MSTRACVFAISHAATLTHACRSYDQEATNHGDTNVFSLYNGHEESLPSDVYNPFDVDSDLVLGMNSDDIGGDINNWPFVNRYQSRERSILTNFFQSRNDKIDDNTVDDNVRMTTWTMTNEKVMTTKKTPTMTTKKTTT